MKSIKSGPVAAKSFQILGPRYENDLNPWVEVRLRGWIILREFRKENGVCFISKRLFRHGGFRDLVHLNTSNVIFRSLDTSKVVVSARLRSSSYEELKSRYRIRRARSCIFSILSLFLFPQKMPSQRTICEVTQDKTIVYNSSGL